MPSKKLTEEQMRAEYEKEMGLIDAYNADMQAIDEANKVPDVTEEPSTGVMGALETAANVADIPSALVRTGVEAAISPKREIIPEVTKFGKRVIEEPTKASTFAPRGEDINKAIDLQLGLGLRPESIPGKIAGFTTELALESAFNPVGVGLSAVKKVRNIIRKPLISASEKQAVNAVSRYVTKPMVAAEGVDPEIIGKRLVAEDLQGELRNPERFYKKITGSAPILKEAPDSLDTLVIKRGKKEPGLIGKISEDITSLMSAIDKSDDVKIRVSEVGNKILFDKIKDRMSKISGVTPDEEAIRNNIIKALKPYTEVKIPTVRTEMAKMPGTLELSPTQIKGTIGFPVETELTLSEAQDLRKNIGQLLSDRDFYKTPDQSMALETETLREIYSELGDSIKKTLKGRQVRVGTKDVDALQFYEAQNNKLKTLYDLKSMLQYTPLNEMKKADMLAVLSGMTAQGAVLGATGAAASLFDFPEYATTAGLVGGVLGAGTSAAKDVKQATPEYLTSIFKQAAKVAPVVAPPLATHGSIMFLRGGKPVAESEMGRSPQSIGIDPMTIAKTRLPRTTEGLIQNKELVVAKLSQNNVPPEIIKAVVQALNDDPEVVASTVPMLISQFPNLFEKSKYNMFDGIIVDPMDLQRAENDVKKRKDLNSIERARILNELNLNQRYIGD